MKKLTSTSGHEELSDKQQHMTTKLVHNELALFIYRCKTKEKLTMNSMKRHLTMIIASVASILMFSGCISFDGGISPSSKSTMEDKFSGSIFQASNGVKLPLRTYCPHDASPHSLPLVVYLHGAGQNGNDNKGQLDSSLGKIFSFTTSRDDYRALVAAPQCPREAYWRDDDVLEALKELIESLSTLIVVDPDRVYITGFSMGGDASWKLALNWPELMTTIVPVCGGPL